VWHSMPTMWKPFALALTVVGLNTLSTPSTLSTLSTQGTSEILWDTYGVPHIFAPDPDALFYAFGWAQMEAHGDLILRLYGEARGRSAEYWVAQSNLEIDKWVRRMGVPSRAREWYAAQSPAERRRLDAFVAGANAYARAHPDRIADEVEIVLPITPTDVVAHGQRVVLFEFVTSRNVVNQATKSWSEQIPSNGPGAQASSVGAGASGLVPAVNLGGSNAWAIAPSRSASGHAMLVANPHLPWSGFFRWFEAHLVAPGLNVTGAALVGNPLVGIAFNDQLGWTHTNNTLDGFDLYELTLNGNGYWWLDGPAEAGRHALRAFDVETQTLKVKQRDGTTREEPFVIKRSIHGPVVSEKPGKALALRIVGLDQPHIADQYWDMARAKSFAEFEGAVRRLQNPFYTVMYADRAGRIMHLFGGRTPVRPAGNYDWAGIVPGESSATLWTTTHPYDELPSVVDPASGWLQNANDPPWTTTFPPAISANAYPPYMAPRSMHFRAQRSARMLAEDDRVTFDEAVAYKHSTRMELADRILDDLLPPAKQAGGAAARAAEVLEAWDRSADASSRGGVLFERFNAELNRLPTASGKDGPFAVKWTEREPRTTPDGLADPAAAVVALGRAVASLQKDGLALDVRWGDVYRLRRAGVDLPGNGGPGDLGIFRVAVFRRAEDGTYEAAGGDSFMYVAEFSTPVRAVTSVAPGNWSQPGSAHAADQLALFAEKRLKPAWRTRADIDQHLERKETVDRQP
jgi:acyl-homoserine-lactone acylase